jgi:hypothetical protein
MKQLCAFISACVSAGAFAQQTGVLPQAFSGLRDQDVLVIYDSRIADSRAVAEFYAGSAKVPGGSGGLVGRYPGLRTLDLASTGAAASTPGNITYSDFVSKIRNPIRTHLTNTGSTTRVRCFVLTKGLPHRIQDTNAANCGDFTGSNATDFPAQFDASDANCASVDSELTLLWQNLDSGEVGGAADSKSDGAVLNPYWKSNQPLLNFTTANMLATKTLTASSGGPVWVSNVSGAARLTAGDIYLVTRLDGHTVQHVRDMITRADGFMYNVNTDAVILDESNGVNTINTPNNGEFDNYNPAMAPLYDSDDYEQVLTQMTVTDKRFATANILHNNAPNSTGFYIGPRVNWQAGLGIRVNNPVVLLATYGSNHEGTFPNTVDLISARMIFADSFNYPAGAIFNTIESWNGRDFGGLGLLGFQMQEQAADFIAAGGTFALANAWEPLADSVPDNRYIVQNFVLGNLTWAEAAWTSIPALSWMQMVLGDPLARAQRSSEDVDGNGRVDIDDLYAFERAPVDINRSGVADSADRAVLMRVLRYNEKPDVQNRR